MSDRDDANDIRTALQPLVHHPSTAPPPLDQIHARARRRRTRRRALGGAAAVATVATVAVGVQAWALDQPDRARDLATAAGGQQAPEPAPPTQGPAPGPEGQAPPELTPEPTIEAAPPPEEPPPSTLTIDPTPGWAAAPLPAAQAPAAVEAWNSDPDARVCPALAPDDLGEGAGATPRVTDRGQPGAWWVEYDLPGAPGEEDIQSPAADAGRASFFVSATIGTPGYEFPVTEESITSWPNVHRWSDGSSVGWGVAGRGVLQQSNPEWPTQWLAYMELEGSRCFYQVGSYLSEEHLIFLLEHLRFVEGAP